MTAAALEARRILLGEDDQALCDLFQAAFAIEGYAVEACPDGVSSLAQVARLRPSLVLLDAELPPTGGLDVVQHLRKKGNLVPIIFISGKSDPKIEQACRRWPHVEYLAKPFSLHELLNAVARAGQF